MTWWWPFNSTETHSDSLIPSPSSTPSSSNLPQDVPSTAKISPDRLKPASQPKTLSRDELAYEELKDLFSGIDAEGAQRAASAAKLNVKQSAARAVVAAESSIYPSTMSCRAAFDQAFYCQSIGGQMNSIYRYGALRSCTELWQQWRFCLRMKAVKEEERAVRVREFYKERALKYKRGPSSEDVWDIRRSADVDGESIAPTMRGEYTA